MRPPIPRKDGEINVFNLRESSSNTPRIYYVNGIRVPPRNHTVTASLLSVLTERPVNGVYNKTSGALLDLAQCGLDYLQNATARTSSSQNLNRPPVVSDDEVNAALRRMVSNSIVWNNATFQLFRSLVEHRRTNQMIIAHSQGNLITSNALFVLEDLLGASALRNIRVYSLASPAPAWPLGLRKTNGGGGRQENAFMNDLVMLLRPHNLAAKFGIRRFQNEGDFRTHEGSGAVSITPHDTNLNIALNFLLSIRGDLGLSKELSDSFLADSIEIVEETFSKDPTWKQWFDQQDN